LKQKKEKTRREPGSGRVEEGGGGGGGSSPKEEKQAAAGFGLGKKEAERQLETRSGFVIVGKKVEFEKGKNTAFKWTKNKWGE
jgi:hypothetical protein